MLLNQSPSVRSSVVFYSFKERDYIVSAEEKGMQIGIEKGELTKSIQIARKMLAKKRPIEEIHDITELSIEKINQLKKGIENTK
ncbi:MAG: hypothetical protein RCO49_04265 [Rickettsia endosymbiont of Argas persicus]